MWQKSYEITAPNLKPDHSNLTTNVAAVNGND